MKTCDHTGFWSLTLSRQATGTTVKKGCDACGERRFAVMDHASDDEAQHQAERLLGQVWDSGHDTPYRG
jgi:hypothetical protein